MPCRSRLPLFTMTREIPSEANLNGDLCYDLANFDPSPVFTLSKDVKVLDQTDANATETI